MTKTDAFKLEIVTLKDIPAISQLWFAAFPDMEALFPNTPAMHQWWDDANRADMIRKPFQKYLKVVDTHTLDERGRPRLVAYAKWDLSMPEERGPRFPPWHESQPALDCDTLFQGLESERARVMGSRRHYYLDMLATHPEYRRRGAGSMLVKWGCDLADREGVGAYVDASQAGVPLYKKFGFVSRSQTGSDSLILSMARDI
ncbi:hypothetical protein PDE_01405 [Penicillium oxalicum 114-2]|uniref:N-acetyltransferase domain-containing protein n=1 Tax=Penicillium oxalicum (strain 114-2 / CGMCC 5302) TaxID=933388 RepID=S8AKV5_PENO1|nr:hypothetical protein PDE_01405 [Penicillium oxalicum 114-2]